MARRRDEESLANLPDQRRSHLEDPPPVVLMDDDVKQFPPRYAVGYPRVAGFMACGNNFAIFRKFDRMAYRSILHQQTQLLEIEHNIDEMDALDDELIRLVPKVQEFVRINHGEHNGQRRSPVDIPGETSPHAKKGSSIPTVAKKGKGLIRNASPLNHVDEEKGDKRNTGLSQGVQPQTPKANERAEQQDSDTNQKTRLPSQNTADQIEQQRSDDVLKRLPPVITESVAEQRWIEVILRMHYTAQGVQYYPHIVHRGSWDRGNINRTTVSIVFPSEDPSIGPIVFQEQSSSSAGFPGAASWQFETAGNDDHNLGLNIRSAIDNRFWERLADFSSTWTTAGKTKRRSQPLSEEDDVEEATMRFFLYFLPVEMKVSESSMLAYSICSTRSMKSVKKMREIMRKSDPYSVPSDTVLSVQRLVCVTGDDWKQHDLVHVTEQRVDFMSSIWGTQHDLLVTALAFMRNQRSEALRDETLMARSTRREDIMRVVALSRLERRLAAYRGALLQQAQLAVLEEPSTRGLTTLRHWFWRRDPYRQNPQRLPLQGLAKDIYAQKEQIDDLISVGPPARKDYLSNTIDYFLGRLFARKGKQPMQDLGGTYFYSDSKIANLVSFIGAFLAVGLLIGAIVGLDQLDKKASRLGLICALTVAFALVLLLTTTSTRGEVFGASAAYAAVLVVYVGGALDKTSE